MTSTRLPFRVVAVTGAAAFLLSFAHVPPAAAQTSTRHVATCLGGPQAGESTGECTITVPSGKVFIIESATFGGLSPTGQVVRVQVGTRKGASTFWHTVPAGFQVLDLTATYWSGALPGTVFAEPGPVTMRIIDPPTRARRGSG